MINRNQYDLSKKQKFLMNFLFWTLNINNSWFGETPKHFQKNLSVFAKEFFLSSTEYNRTEGRIHYRVEKMESDSRGYDHDIMVLWRREEEQIVEMCLNMHFRVKFTNTDPRLRFLSIHYQKMYSQAKTGQSPSAPTLSLRNLIFSKNRLSEPAC